jgi:CDP-paratose 2-epimerase
MSENYFITGGSGFIGSNFVDRLLQHGERVTIFDNLSRAGSRRNLEWLRKKFGDKAFELIIGDVRNADLLKESAKNATIFVHLAAQVAVTTSVTHPRDDFDVNALGTFNALEAARASGKNPVFIYASTNKVYGGMDDLRITEEASRYTYKDFPKGIAETYPLDFHSPYGCSKGCGDQYVRDYHRIYNLPTVVFRQSCIYGTRQFGIEDQGWVAWFVIAAATGRPIKIYGDGKQIRDLLFVDDLLNAYESAILKREIAGGQIYNVGGGIKKSVSVYFEFFPILEKLLEKKIIVTWGDWRPGDQKVYISDIRKAHRDLDWQPKIGVDKGVKLLFDWVLSNADLF